MRQRPDRYTIRAGRNLPDKEFRYLRTVIVTAAIHQGLNSMLCLTADISFDLLALGRHHTIYFDLSRLCIVLVFLLNSRLGHFSAATFASVASTVTDCGSSSPEVTRIICRVP